MTEGALFVTGGIFIVGAYLAILADYVMTLKGLDKGLTEVGFLASKVVKKWGKNALALYTFGVAGVVTVLAGVTGNFGGEYMLAYAAPLFGVLAINDLRNYLKLRKVK